MTVMAFSTALRRVLVPSKPFARERSARRPRLQPLLQAFSCLILATSCSALSAEDRTPSAAVRIGTITDVGVLAHPVCTLRLATESNPDSFVFAEGDICPLGGGACSYHALLNIDGKDERLQKATGRAKSRSFQSADGTIRARVQYGISKCWPENGHCESTEGWARLVVTKGKDRIGVEARADCGA